MQPNRSRSEIETLRDLLGDFAAPGWGPDRAGEAFDRVADRYIVLGSRYVAVAEALADAVDEAVGSLSLPVACQAALFFAHRHLFRGILSNAGETRRSADPGGGRVYFGGQKGDRRKMRFTGTPPDAIGDELREAFSRLTDLRDESRRARARARDNAVLFYADLPRIHPFYDGNGRTGRFVVSVYLHLHGWLVEWGRLEKKDGEFIRRINNVNEKATAQTDYSAFLLGFWRRYVAGTDDLR